MARPCCMLRAVQVSRATLVSALVVLALCGGGLWAYLEWDARRAAAAAEERRQERERQTRERQEQAIAWVASVQEESEQKMPPMLEGLGLGMTLDEVRHERPDAQPHPTAREPGKMFLGERLRNGAEVIYGFEARSRRLLQIQIMSRMPGEGVGPHLEAMQEQYGRPTGIWDCPNTGGVPTRRFTWRGSHVALADIFLVHPGGVSVTLYLAATETIGRSLQISNCHPVEGDAIATFPAATAEQIQAAQPPAQLGVPVGTPAAPVGTAP